MYFTSPSLVAIDLTAKSESRERKQVVPHEEGIEFDGFTFSSGRCCFHGWQVLPETTTPSNGS